MAAKTRGKALHTNTDRKNRVNVNTADFISETRHLSWGLRGCFKVLKLTCNDVVKSVRLMRVKTQPCLCGKNVVVGSLPSLGFFLNLCLMWATQSQTE